jgi:hypothetical protein
MRSEQMSDPTELDRRSKRHRALALNSAEVAEEAAVERKEVRRVRPLLSELQQVPRSGRALAGKGPAEVEKGVEEHQDTEKVCFTGTRSWVVCGKIPR